MKSNYIITIKAEDRPGLLHLVTGVLNRRLTPIISLTAAPTDVHDMVLISIETALKEDEISQLTLKLENIVEVFSVEIKAYQEEFCLRAAWFRLDKKLLDTPAASCLQKYSGVIVQWYTDSFLLAKYGSDKAIRDLYNQLDGSYLLGFSQTGIINDSVLIDQESNERIIRLAA